MNLFYVFSISNILFFGAVCGYSDIRYGKIYNAYLAYGFVSGLLILALSYGRYIDNDYLAKVMINGTAGMTLSYFLWFSKRWSAGDAKLFSFFAFFVPLEYYQNSYVRFFPAVNILINVFTIVMAYMSVQFIVFLAERIRQNKFSFSLATVRQFDVQGFLRAAGSYVLIIFFFYQLSRISILSRIFSNSLVLFCVMFFLYSRIMRSREISRILSICSAVIAVFLIVFERNLLYSLVMKVLLFVFMIRALRAIFDCYISEKETDGVKVADLKKGQVLVNHDTKRIEKLVYTHGVIDEYRETRNYGLNASQIRIIQRLFKRDDVLVAYRTLSFGPLLFAGAIVTLLTKDSIIRMLLAAVSGS